MKLVRTIIPMVAVLLLSFSISLYSFRAARASDHQDSPTVVSNPPADITDVFAFPDPHDASKVALAMNVYPLIPSGMTSGKALDNNVLYQFKIANAGVASGTGIDSSLASTNGTVAGTLAAGQTNYGKVTLTANSNILLGGGTDLGGIGQTAGTISLGTATLANSNVLTVAGANSTIQAVDSALQSVSALQSQLGAIQNRFTSTVANLQSTVQNLTASRSTIQDADFAAETAKLTQSNVLQQAGISVLAQANQAPQLILKLLQ